MEYKKVKLKEVCTVNQGLQIPISKRFKEKGPNRYFYITIQFLKGNTDEYYIENPKKSVICHKEDILVVRTGNTGMVLTGVEGCFHNNFFKVEPNEKIYSKYLYYTLNNKYMYKEMLNAASGTTIPDLKHSAFYDLTIPLPTISEQHKIVNILESIDKKIKLNNQINDNLLKFIKEFYKETFKYEQNKKKIKEVVEFSQGVQVPIENQSEKYENGFIRFIRIVDLTQGGKDNIRYIENKDRGIVDYDDVFMIRYGSPGILGWNYKGIIANNLFKINPKSDETTKNYLYCYFNDDEIQNYIKQNATSSTMPAINFSLLYDRLIAIPNKEKLTEFDRIIENTRLKLLEIKKENEKLEQLRDTLLPKLMNGEIDLEKIYLEDM